MNIISRELRFFCVALAFLTRLPVPGWVEFNSESMNASARYFPLVGVIVGAVSALAFIFFTWFFPIARVSSSKGGLLHAMEQLVFAQVNKKRLLQS